MSVLVLDAEMDVPMNAKPLLNDWKLTVFQMYFSKVTSCLWMPNYRNPGLTHAWKYEFWSKTKLCGLGPPVGFYEMWALKVPTARVNTGGVGSSWEEEQKPGSLGLDCKSSSGAGSLGNWSGSRAGLLGCMFYMMLLRKNCEGCSVLKFQPRTRGTKRLSSISEWISEPPSVVPALEEIRAILFHS